MLRNLFVAAILVVGIASLLRGPFYALLLYLWFAYFRPDQWLWTDWVTPAHVSLLIGTAAVLLTLMFIGAARLRWRTETTLLALFFAQSLLSALYAQDTVWAWTWWTDFARVLLIGYLITMHVTDAKRMRLILLVIALSLGFEAAKEGWAGLVLHPGGRNMNPHPVLGDNNGVALGMFMLAPIVLALARTTRTWWPKWMHRFLLGGVILRGLATYSRGGFLAAGGLAAMSFAHSRRRIRALLVLGVVGGAALSVMPPQFWHRMDTITAPESKQDESARGRLHFWHVALRMAADHPLTGVGFNNFERVYNRWDNTDGAYGVNRAVHSTWFGALAEMGIPGLALLLAILLRSLWNCRKVRRMTVAGEEADMLREFAAALEASLVVYIIGGTFINAHYSEMFWHFICLTTALSWTAEELVQRVTASAGAEGAAVATQTPSLDDIEVPGRFVPEATLSRTAGASWSDRPDLGRRRWLITS